MPRSVNHVASKAKRTKILKLTKGYYGARKNVWTVAKNTWEKGLTYAYRDRRNKKRNFRALWIQRINAAARLDGMSYSQLMGALHKAGIETLTAPRTVLPIRRSSARRSSRAVAHGSSSRSTSATSSACVWTASASSPPSCSSWPSA